MGNSRHPDAAAVALIPPASAVDVVAGTLFVVAVLTLYAVAVVEPQRVAVVSNLFVVRLWELV